MSNWINVNDKLPDTSPWGYESEMSASVLVKGDGKNSYPWVAHLHKDGIKNNPTYAWGFDKDNFRYTWLSPYRNIEDNQKITQWMPIPELEK